MRIQANIAALNSHNRLTKNQSTTTKTLEKLASGYRINRAADDAAGLTISEGMRAQIRGLKRATLNAQDGLSYVQTADSVVQGATQTVQRMRELTVQALNDTLVESDRKAIQKEVTALTKSIEKMSTDATYNDSLKSVEMHEASFGMLTGNARFDGPVTILPGYNDSLTFIAEGQETTITIPAGTYEPVDVLIDELDTILMEKNPNVILNVTDDKHISVQIENAKDIAKVKGTGSFLFYEYELGTKPGMIIGTTSFLKSDGTEGELQVTTGVNDKLSLYVGPTNKIDITVPAGAYNRDQIIEFLNNKLSGSGAEASKYGDRNIAISSDKYVVTGLGGNMLEIDGRTSILYDIADYGEVIKREGFYYGSKNILSGVTIDETASKLTISANTINGPVETKTIDILNVEETSVNFTSQALVSRLQEKLDEAGFDGRVETQGSNLKITSNYMGQGSNVIIHQSPASQNVFDTLFKENRTYYYTPSFTQGNNAPASIIGNYKDRSNTVFTDANNELKLNIDGNEHTFTIPFEDENNVAIVYDASTIESTLKPLLEPNGVELSVSSYGSRQAFILSSNEHEIQFVSGGAFETLFGGELIEYPSIIQGKDGEPKYPTEGTVGDITIEKFPATAKGKVSINSGLLITSNNNQLKFTVNGVEQNISLENKNYTKDELISTLNIKLAGKGVMASASADGYIQLTTTDKGQGVTLQNVSGLGMERLSNTSPSMSSDEPRKQNATLTAYSSITNIQDPIVVEAGKNEMSFTYTDKSIESNPLVYNITFSVPEGEYSKTDFVDAFKTAFNTEVADNGLTDHLQISEYSGRLQISAKNAGEDYLLTNFSGDMFDEVFKRYNYTATGYSSSGYNLKNDSAYIVGRQELPDIIEIFPSNNDVLTFDLTYKGTTYTIDVQVPPNSYSKNGFVTAFNTSLEKALEDRDLPKDAVRAQIGAPGADLNVSNTNKFTLVIPTHNDGRDDNGEMKIEGVRGAGAYTYFYFSQGDAKPSHVVGIVDLSGGVKIEENINDELSIDVDGVTKIMNIPAGDYAADDFLTVMNDTLDQVGSGLIASYDNGKMKLSYRENGPITIDGLAGSARDYLFFKTERRDNQDPLHFQIGANENQQLTLKHVTLSDKILRINTLSIETQERANKALSRFDQAIKMLSERAGTLGALENRLEHTMNVNNNISENLTAAESRIRDTDMAKEMMNFTKQNILIQAAQSMLAQANKTPEAVLQLLQ